MACENGSFGKLSMLRRPQYVGGFAEEDGVLLNVWGQMSRGEDKCGYGLGFMGLSLLFRRNGRSKPSIEDS